MEENTRTLTNKVPQIIERLSISQLEFKGKVIAAGLSLDTAERLLEGETKFSVQTLARLANHLNLENITDLVSLE